MVVMAGDEERSRLRGAMFRGDGAEIVQLVTRRPWPADALQLIGDGLLIALRQDVEGASSVAAECVDALQARGWVGDDELAKVLLARLGTGPTALLRPLTIDLEELAMALEGDPAEGGGRIDLRSGEVWPQSAIDYSIESGEEDEDFDDPDRWLWVDSQGSRAGYRDMEWFIAHLEDPEVADRLSIAITGRGAFRRFKDVLSRWPDLVERWHGFSEERHRGRARSWLTDQGYTATYAVLSDR
jgi:hypothetical protein